MLAWIELTTGTLFVILVFGIPVIAILCECAQKVARVWSDNNLKRTMVERGMSVEQIERVLAAGTAKWHETIRKLSDDDLKRMMIERGIPPAQADEMLKSPAGARNA